MAFSTGEAPPHLGQIPRDKIHFEQEAEGPSVLWGCKATPAFFPLISCLAPPKECSSPLWGTHHPWRGGGRYPGLLQLRARAASLSSSSMETLCSRQQPAILGESRGLLDAIPDACCIVEPGGKKVKIRANVHMVKVLHYGVDLHGQSLWWSDARGLEHTH